MPENTVAGREVAEVAAHGRRAEQVLTVLRRPDRRRVTGPADLTLTRFTSRQQACDIVVRVLAAVPASG